MASAGRRPDERSLGRALLVSLRPHQWTKNLIVFAGIIFSERLLEPGALARSAAAFAIFCALSSAAYLLNDIHDREADRQHPLKAGRPIASGVLPVPLALGVAIALAACGMAAALFLRWQFAALGAGYLALQALYSGPLKRIVIIDVLAIAAGFVLRAAAGAAAIAVPMSSWLLVVTVLLALFLALSKRRHELVLLADGAANHRPILGEYSPYLLDQMISVVTASTLVAYAFYTISPETQEKFHTNLLGLTLPFPLYGIFRYLYLVHRKDLGGSPSELLLADKPLLLCVALWALTVMAIIYGPQIWEHRMWRAVV
ncbi:MAG TPA: decaprenyl-phosphate phosphoribosyltransferase [Vicinamibacterales bacterium]|nr:decaprenyl-phosphate phosphoribosyltransferase [Vicinamibacterales bacterium]